MSTYATSFIRGQVKSSPKLVTAANICCGVIAEEATWKYTIAEKTERKRQSTIIGRRGTERRKALLWVKYLRGERRADQTDRDGNDTRPGPVGKMSARDKVFL